MIIMARILTPEDYGLVGMLTIFIAISQSLVNSGFSQALIRKQDRSEVDNSTVFYFNIGVGLVLYLLLFLCAPLIARFYNEPILVPLTRLISVSVLINSFVVVQRALLTVRIDFKTQAKASSAAAVVSGAVGITMAYTGSGVWSIVWYQLTNLTVNVGLLWILSPWRPQWIYSWKSFRELFSFGSKLALSGVLESLYQNIYLMIIGKVFKASDLGYYTRAHQFAEFPSSNVSGIIQRVTFPILCSIQDDDERLRSVYRRFLRLSAFIVFPLMIGLAAVAHPFILLVLKEQWEFAAVLLQIICLGMMWYPIHAINLNYLIVKGRSDLFFRLEVIKKIQGVIILCVTIPLGLEAMCYGSIVSSLLSLIWNTYYNGKFLNMSIFKQLHDFSPILLLSGVMYIGARSVAYFMGNDLTSLICSVATGAAIYIGGAFLFRFPEIKELKELKK